MEQKNLSIELLNKLIGDEIRLISRSDIVKGDEFSQRLIRIMKNYRESLLDNAESLDKFVGLVKEDKNDYNLGMVRQALIDLAKEIVRLEEENQSLGLSKEELAFYHAISKPENINNFYTDQELISFTQELTEVIAKEMTPDWMMRKSGRASMRRAVKRLLARYEYPKDSRNKIIDLIVEQAEYFDGVVV